MALSIVSFGAAVNAAGTLSGALNRASENVGKKEQAVNQAQKNTLKPYKDSQKAVQQKKQDVKDTKNQVKKDIKDSKKQIKDDVKVKPDKPVAGQKNVQEKKNAVNTLIGK